MHQPFTHFLSVLIAIIAGTTVLIAVAVRLFFLAAGGVLWISSALLRDT